MDRVLDSVDEEVRITTRIQPEDVSNELMGSTAYLARLEAIGRDTGFREEDLTVVDPPGMGNEGYTSWHDRIQPLHRRDPLADDLARTHRRFHESLRLPHFLFEICVTAETEATARLVGSIMAESAFQEGSYRLIVSSGETSNSGRARASDARGMVGLVPNRQAHWPDMARSTYGGFGRLCQLASVEELLGAFRFPVASFASPCCIRKDTDPPEVDLKNLVLLGHEQSLGGGGPDNLSGPARGLAIDLLNRHWFVAGVSGTGKTTAVMNTILQLSGLLPIEANGKD